VKYIFTLALLMPGALRAMQLSESDLGLDLGSEKSYKKLVVVANLCQEPYGMMSQDTLRRYYTNAHARLHHHHDIEQRTLKAGNYEATVNLMFPLKDNSTQVVVDYELTQLPWISLIFNPTTITSHAAHLTIGGVAHKKEHRTSNNELVTLTLIAEWQAYKVTDYGRHVKLDDDHKATAR